MLTGMAIRDWPSDERPREKLLDKGAAALSDAELLAILLRTGTPGHSALDLARDALKSFHSLRKLIAADRQRFCAERGLGLARFAELQAAVEIARAGGLQCEHRLNRRHHSRRHAMNLGTPLG